MFWCQYETVAFSRYIQLMLKQCKLRPHLSIRTLVFLLLVSLTTAVSSDEGELETVERGTPVAEKKPDEPSVAPQEETDAADDKSTESEEQADEQVPAVKAFRLLDSDVAPGSLRRLAWYPNENSAGLAEATPVIIAHGQKSGPTLCLTAAVHGDELNGIEIARNLLYDINPERLNGTLIGVPIVNLYGFRLGSRYLSDRRDLNRYFPGNEDGSSASRIAHSLFQSVIKHCDYLVDLHTGSFQRANLPQLRADLNNADVLNLTKGFGATVVLHGEGPEGSLRGEATKAGIPTVTLEAGEPMRVQSEEVEHGVKALRSLLNYLGMVSRFSLWGEPQPIYYESAWVRAEENGILTSTVTLGSQVSEGELLGKIVDPITNSRSEIHSPVDGRIIGMALNQSMRPGYAAYHIGIQKSEDEIVEGTAMDVGDDTNTGEQDMDHSEDIE